jgi:8-amino-7-oxononanoate synthase
MEANLNNRLVHFLSKRASQDNLRSLKINQGHIDFSSNDYLGFSRSAWIHQHINEDIKNYQHLPKGATGSRLLNGQTQQIDDLENQIAEFHNGEAAILFNSGFDANMGLISTLTQRGDLIIYDELIHSSMHAGINLSKASSVSFKHNDLEDFITKIPSDFGGQIFVLIESIYSMEGDFSPLKELCLICEKKGIYLILDEAHALGILGKRGKGLANEAGVEHKIFARVYTYGKALGAHGAAVVGSKILKDYLINFCKPFIYSTALDLHSVLSIKWGYKFLLNNKNQIIKLNKLNNYLNERIITNPAPFKMVGQGPIFGIYCSTNQKAKNISCHLISKGIDIRAILYPTVPLGFERLRLIIHSYNTKEEIDFFLDELTIQFKMNK